MGIRNTTVAERRHYCILDVQAAKQVARLWLERVCLHHALGFGLPEIDDRYHVWRVPLIASADNSHVGEMVIDARTSLILEDKTTAPDILERRLLGREETKKNKRISSHNGGYVLSSLRNTIALGDSVDILQDLPAESVNLVFTSPPYYNARPEYTDYVTYEEYLLTIRKVIQQTHRVLAEGCFFVINISPVLVRRANRNQSSRRIAVPFDIHRIFIEEGYDFIDDII
jgi:hypothetical protein